jgi:hypothetical protein
MIRPGQSPETVFGENNNLPFAGVGKWLITRTEMNMIFLKRKPASFFEKKQAKVLETIQSLVSKIDVGEIVSVSKGYGGFTVTTPDGRCIKKVEAIKLDLIQIEI